MNGLINYVSCGLLWLGLVVKAPDLVRHRGDPYLRAICAVLGLAGVCFFLGAEPTVAAVNHLSGTPNLAAPLTYASITAYSAASQVLIVYWRGGPHAPVERRTDLDTYYATTPFIAEMIVLYLAGHLAAVSVTTVSSLRWAREVRGWLRAGLVVLGFGALCNAGYSISKLAAVVARWSGRDWSGLSTTVSPAAAGVAALMTVTGILIPLVGPRATRWRRARRDFTRLEPLERELDEFLTRRSLRLPRPRWASPAARLVWRQTSIHNALGSLDAFFDPDLYERTLEAAARESGDPERAEATAWAAVIAAAAVEERDRHSPDRAPLVPSDGTERFQDRGAPAPGTLVGIADALTASPLVAAARVRAGTTRTGTA
jgi:hypothetical protein